MEVKCTKCGERLEVQAKAVIDEQEKITVSLTLKQGQLVGADTLGACITSMAKVLKATAKEIGEKVEVMVSDCRFVGDIVDIDFVVLQIKGHEKSASIRKIMD